jgi:hypothetical protein
VESGAGERSRIVVCSALVGSRRVSLTWVWDALSVKPPTRVVAPTAVVVGSSW